MSKNHHRTMAFCTSLLIALPLLGGCSPDIGPVQGESGERTFSGSPTDVRPVPEELETIPAGYGAPASQQGTLTELAYDTYESTTYEQKTQRLAKRAMVYLPYNYDAKQQYNVFYLMHGGFADETRVLGTPESPSSFKNVLDNAVESGQIQPLIIVAPTYNSTSENDSDNFSLALTLTENFHRELLSDLMPAVEGKYSTYAAGDTTPSSFRASRDHRGFGGFSMGSVATWRTFQYDLDYFRYFLPMSCGTTLDMDSIMESASDHDPSDYFVWIITGSRDFAQPYDERRVELMGDSWYFTQSDDERDGNFAFRVKDGYSHDEQATQEYTYNGLRWFWAS
ncbi:alpha/beta hydrolase [Bifidobacterium psychraerophilum]|uniref:alpha/beta hydrolase n=1 Tax=Bifidobacterium psychraerophilum TaxID=218140 RepID=UPI0039EBBDE3